MLNSSWHFLIKGDDNDSINLSQPSCLILTITFNSLQDTNASLLYSVFSSSLHISLSQEVFCATFYNEILGQIIAISYVFSPFLKKVNLWQHCRITLYVNESVVKYFSGTRTNILIKPGLKPLYGMFHESVLEG